MNVYEKLLKARSQFHDRAIVKSGWNDFSKYNYFELEDFVVPIIEIFTDVRLLSVVSFTKEVATMVLIDIDKPEDRIEFTSPMGGAQLKGTHEIQQIGAVETYQRRYLYVMAMDIVEHDALENTTASPMMAAKTLEELQKIYADEYRAVKGNKRDRDRVKDEYDKLKVKFETPADPATEPAE